MPTPERFRFHFRIAAFLAGLVCALVSACGDGRVAGTSSGVDNPSLTVGFRDTDGSAMRVTGDLDVYGRDQNPAVDAEPLVTLKVRNSSFTNLTGEDFARLGASASKRGAAPAKTSAARAAGGMDGGSGSMAFNLILKTQDRTGSFVLGLEYDSAAGRFSRLEGEALTRLDVQPKPLIRYEAKVVRDSVHGDGGRIFVPGSPFLATLVDSVFVLEDFPEGTFPIRLLSADGKVYSIPDSLDTRRTDLRFRPASDPIGSLDTIRGQDSIPGFSVQAGPDREAVVELGSALEANVTGIDAADPRLSFLWRQLKGDGDSGRADTLYEDSLPQDSILPPGSGSLRRADILSPTSLRSEVRFDAEGVYQFEITATLGLRARTDTVILSVRRLPPPAGPRIIQPRPGDSLVLGRAYTIQWEMPDNGRGPVRIRVSANGGGTWSTLAENYSGKDGLPILPWVPADSLGATSHALIQVASQADSTVTGVMPGPFNLLQ